MTVRLVNDARAVLSMRESDFDANSAFGEVVDNSIQANAKTVKVRLDYKGQSSRKKDEFRVITHVAFGDDGIGMAPEVLHHCLQLGYSTRYGDRSGIGRFGVGMTLAAINQCKRIEIYSQQRGSKWMWTYVDLDEMTSEPPKTETIPEPIEKALPGDMKALVGNRSGTLVIWSSYDRQIVSAHKMLPEMHVWLGRTYRHFLWNDLTIEVNGDSVKAIDPLGVTTRSTKFPNDPPAYEYEPIKFAWPVSEIDRPKGSPAKSIITIKLSLLDESLRPYRGSGGSADARERHIDDNEGISILRNGREVFYGHLPYWGTPFENIDRWWGCETSFDAVLDRAFTVKNIKRGALPLPALRKIIKERIQGTIDTARESVREIWDKYEKKKKEEVLQGGGESLITGHEEAEAVAAKTPSDESEIDKGKDPKKEAADLVDRVMKDETRQRKEGWKAKFADQPFSIKDESWKGPDFMETHHLGGKDVILYNGRHDFFKILYGIIDSLEDQGIDTPAARKLKNLIDLLLISYSKAEAKFDKNAKWSAEQFLEMLRGNWGMYLTNYISTWQGAEHDE